MDILALGLEETILRTVEVQAGAGKEAPLLFRVQPIRHLRHSGFEPVRKAS